MRCKFFTMKLNFFCNANKDIKNIIIINLKVAFAYVVNDVAKNAKNVFNEFIIFNVETNAKDVNILDKIVDFNEINAINLISITIMININKATKVKFVNFLI